MSSAISIAGLSVSFGDLKVLDSVELEVSAGQFVAIVGPSGCGKSTLLRVLARLADPSAGHARIKGEKSVGDASVAYMPQKDLLLPWRRALGNALLGADVAGVDSAESRAHGQQLFERFGLGGFERAWPHELSGGMRQRVAVLRTFLTPHAVLLLDEPFGALDAITRRSMQSWLEEVWSEDKRATLLVTHDVEEALLLADRVLVMSARPGRILLDIDVKLERPRGDEISTSDEFVALKRQVLDTLRVD